MVLATETAAIGGDSDMRRQLANQRHGAFFLASHMGRVQEQMACTNRPASIQYNNKKKKAKEEKFPGE